MFGGPPIMAGPGFLPPTMQPSYPGPFAPSPGPRPPAYANQQPPAPTPQWNAAAIPDPPAPQPIVRAQAPDDPPAIPRPRALVLPTPEALGLAASETEPASLDWTAVHQQLDRLGVTCFQLEQSETGGFRITCLLPTASAGRSHRVEAQAATKAEVVRMVLLHAEAWAAQQRP